MELSEIFSSLRPMQEIPGMRLIQVATGFGFYLAEDDCAEAQAEANRTQKTQFLGRRFDGGTIKGKDRQQLIDDPDCKGIAWIIPEATP